MNVNDKEKHLRGRCDCLVYTEGTSAYDSARKSLREDNATALTYSGIWLGIIFVIFSLTGQSLLQQGTPAFLPEVLWLTIVVEGLLLLAAILMMLACWIYWHGCSFEHNPAEYLVMNESGDSLMTFASLLTMMGVSLSGSTIFLRTLSAELYSNRFLLLLAPLILTIAAVSLANYLFSPRISKVTILHEFLIEASKLPYYGWLLRLRDFGDLTQNEIKKLKELVECKKLRRREALFMILIFVLVLHSAWLCVR